MTQPKRRCAWCPKDTKEDTVLQCPRCKRWYCTPALRDCMVAHDHGKDRY